MKDLSALAQQHLRSASTKFPPYRFSPMFRRALAQCGYGLDHIFSEEVLAIVNHSQSREEFMGVIVTTFAVVARFGEERVCVPFENLLEAELHEGMFSTVIKLRTRDDEVELPVLRDARIVAQFLSAAAGYRPHKRYASAVFTPTQQDPACVETFISSLDQGDDPRFAEAAGQARHQLTQGRDSAAVQDHVARLQMLRLQLTRGRAMHEGRFVSPLRPAALKTITEQLLPPPVKEPADLIPNPSEVRDQVQAALLEKAVGAAVSTAFGVQVDLEEIMGDDEVSCRRFQLFDGPTTSRIIGTAGQADSTWTKIKNLANKALGDANTSTELGAFTLEGKVGRRWRELAQVEPDRAFSLIEQLEQHEIERLLQL